MLEGLADEDGEVSEEFMLHELTSQGPMSAADCAALARAESLDDLGRERGTGRKQGRRSAAARRKAEEPARKPSAAPKAPVEAPAASPKPAKAPKPTESPKPGAKDIAEPDDIRLIRSETAPAPAAPSVPTPDPAVAPAPTAAAAVPAAPASEPAREPSAAPKAPVEAPAASPSAAPKAPKQTESPKPGAKAEKAKAKEKAKGTPKGKAKGGKNKANANDEGSAAASSAASAAAAAAPTAPDASDSQNLTAASAPASPSASGKSKAAKASVAASSAASAAAVVAPTAPDASEGQDLTATSAPASPSASGKSKATKAAGEPSGEKQFKVMGSLHLGLSLKLGNIYSASDLRGRCAGNRERLASLEEFMTKPDKLQPIGGGPAVASSAPAASKAKAKAAAKAKPVQSSPGAAGGATTPVGRSRARSPAGDELAVAVTQRSGKRLRTKTMDYNRFMPGQIVWHNGRDTSRMAKVMSVPDGPSSPYIIIHLADDDRNPFSAMETELNQFNVKDLPGQLMNRDLRNPSGGADEVAVPGERESPNFKVGQYVWYLGAQRPSWPAKVQRVPEEGEDTYEIQRCGTSDGRGFGESIVVKKSELLRLERKDLRAYYQVAERLDVLMCESLRDCVLIANHRASSSA